MRETLEKQRDQILAEWVGAAQTLAAGKGLTVPALVDGMPRALDRLIEGLCREEPFDRLGSAEISGHHAVERLRQGYELSQIVAEYSALRSILEDRVAPFLSPEHSGDLERLHGKIDLAIAEAAERFAAERGRAEAERAARFQAVIENAPVAIFVKEYRRTGGTVVLANRPFARRFGREPHATIGLTDEQLYTEMSSGTLATIHADDARVLATGEPVRVEETSHEDDRRHVWQVIKFPLHDSDGVPRAVCGIATDITEEKDLALARDRVLGILGHDLRNPLSSISMAAEYLLQLEPIDENARRSAARIARMAERMTRIIRDLLDFARGRFGVGIPVQRKACDLGVIARAVVDEHTPPAGRSIHVQVSGDVRGAWDEGRIGQAMSNLVANALVHGEGDVTLDVGDRGDAVRVTIHNEGTPIPESVRATLFEPFHRSTGGSGLGLGLYIVREIARAHGGQVSVASDPTGTTFTMTLPRD